MVSDSVSQLPYKLKKTHHITVKSHLDIENLEQGRHVTLTNFSLMVLNRYPLVSVEIFRWKLPNRNYLIQSNSTKTVFLFILKLKLLLIDFFRNLAHGCGNCVIFLISIFHIKQGWVINFPFVIGNFVRLFCLR